ncbi:hypothetical protein B0H14DRAFT_3443626 [Mycena olivaceomarginata]|nr:hypothetical protein B0H14DRAFT_3443626 [Mycena olivaceomarginata]
MGNITSQRLNLHRFIGLAVCHSTTIDPRHLEHYNYTYWTGDIAALIVGGKLRCCLIAPQFPIYVSLREALRPDTSFGSGNTLPNSEAHGVYVDIAIVMPIGKSLRNFLDDFLSKNPTLSPCCLWVSGFVVPLIAELKPGPTRHADKIDGFYASLSGRLRAGMRQADLQAICLFSSWMFAIQNEIILIAGAGENFRLRRVTRDWATGILRGTPYINSFELVKLLKKEDLDDEEPNWEEIDDVNAVEDGDWTEGQEEDMYGGGPQDALERQQRLNAQRTQRRVARAARSQRYADALNTPPNKDRTAPLFSEEALNAIHKNDTGGELFESRPPDTYFEGTGATAWSGVLQLGSPLSNAYMAKIQKIIQEHEIQEERQREAVVFHKSRKYRVEPSSCRSLAEPSSCQSSI